MNKLNKNIPKNWKWVTLNDIGIIVTGNTPTKKISEFYGHEIPFFKPTDLQQGINVIEAREYLSKLATSVARVIPKNSVMVTSIGSTIGKTGMSKKEGAINQQINAIIPFINSKYVYYYTITNFFNDELIGKSSATTIPIINKSKFETISFPLAPIEEQNRIVDKIEELFSELDSILDVFDELLQKLKLYWYSELKSFHKGDKTKRIKSDSVDDILLEVKKNRSEQKINYRGENESLTNIDFQIPENWKLVKLCDIFVNPLSSISDGPFGSNLKSSDFQKQGYPVLKIQNIDRNEFVTKDITYVSEEKYNELKKHQFICGDIIITKLGSPLGKACIIPSNFKHGVIVADLIRIKKNEYINSKFLMYSLNAPYMISQIEKLSKGTTRQRVTLNGIRNLTLIFPNLSEQEIIANKIEELDDEIKNLTGFIKRTILEVNALKQKILEEAFNGDLVTNDSSKNVEDDYLRKILIEKQKYIILQKEKTKLIPKVKKMKIDLDLEEILQNKNEPIKSFDLWQESKYKDNIEEFYKKLKELDSKIKEFKDGHLSYIELIK